jgi:hypothetical protein
LALKGIVFTLDAIIAFGIVIATVSSLTFIRSEVISPYITAQRLHVVSEDILGVLYNSNLGEIVNQTLLNKYVSDGTLEQEDLSKKTVDVIGALWSSNKTAEAKEVINDILEKFIPSNIGYQIVINNEDIYNSSGSARPSLGDSFVIISSGRIISGYQKYKPVSGYVARSWATKIKKATTKIVPIDLAWGGYADDRYWYNGYAPLGERGNWSMILKNFTLPDDANISSAFMQMSFDNDFANISINGNQVFYGSSLRGQITETNLTSYLVTGVNRVNITFRNRDNDLAHFHPGCYIKINYNTSDMESGSNETVFNAAWLRGAPTANQIIPFSVSTEIKNVTAYVEVRDINAFLLLTLNYKYNSSNPMQNVLLYREYPMPINCSLIASQSACQAETRCSWNSTPMNYTVFYDGFENWGSSDCESNGLWTSCLDTSDSYIRRSSTRNNGSYSLSMYDWDSDDFPTSEGLFKTVNASNYSKLYMTFWFRTSGLDAGEYGRVDAKKGSASWANAFSQQADQDWAERQINITSYIDNITQVGLHEKSSDSSEYFNVDDLRIVGTSGGRCQNNFSESMKNRSYEITFNQTGALIREYDNSSLLNAWFNRNVTIDSVSNNITNTLGIFADIRAPRNLTVEGTGDVDWQRLGMFAHDNTSYPNDYYSYITERSNVTVFHDIEKYGLEYGKIDITSIDNFTTQEKDCITKGNVDSCKDAVLNLSFSFSSALLKTRILGTQNWGGNDNGYNYIWSWLNGTESVESHLVMDTDTPPGTFSQIPIQFLQINRVNIIRVGDKDGGRYLNTDPATMMNNRRSIIEYTLLIPSQVGYGDIFENETAAMRDAEMRLNQTLGSFASATVIQKDSFRVGGVPFMYGPFNFKVNVWV